MNDVQAHDSQARENAEAEVMISLRELAKRFPGSREMAVESLSMDIRAGEVVVFVGPSGCGKTTTMKMINRLIEPSSGRIILEGEDVSDANPDQLRRRIGYVIQQIGLFPHMTIADNIAVVPRMLGWDKKRTNERIDELLETVGIPLEYRNRHPKALSGGQRQRVGVARAMAADPPVLLMDEPFGAIDPITRTRLQNEFLRLQEQIQKTIVFVTHDIDEAIKMGDRIAILRERSQIAQFDTPQKILTGPANDFVRDFVGSGATLKRLSLSFVADMPAADWPSGTVADPPEQLRQTLAQSRRDWLLLLGDEGRPHSWASAECLDRESPETAGRKVRCILDARTTLYEALDAMITSTVGSATVVDDNGYFEKVIDFETVREAIATLHAEARRLDRQGRDASDSGNPGR
ncbi:betaine/proline/choline family ABC transporter ATP-binding protein [Salinisphaera sp.]|uniref:ABC transporter ATP-binding protein n=1 Tax=Salinisphaera sp. TaxID=1914330 RepID=UPI002D776988|nr:betaine/proline/choline family ABC transporter ATP-binding protein [Salinisphaera sp.]HET7313019.1 betaine/proline/choline family ABC transporter ATP-binding protein [Salinisphaera sp.]